MQVEVTTHPGHAHELARRAVGEGRDTVFVVGGDGTANEASQALLHAPVTLAVLPFGSGNGLGRALRIPIRSVRRAAAVLRDAVVKTMDVGLVRAGDGPPRPFLNVAGAGLDAVIGAAFQAHGSNGGRRGIWSYFERGFPVAWHYRADAYEIASERTLYEGRALFVTCANGPQYGAEAYIAPGALLDDGLLDVVAVDALSAAQVTRHVYRLFTRSLERWPRYHRFRVAALEIRPHADRVTYHRDGEPSEGAGPLRISLARHALRVLVPRETLDSPASPFTNS
jgi:diacylglycerol kinase family enzyme